MMRLHDHTHSEIDIDLILEALAAFRSECSAADRERATRLINIIANGFETVTRDTPVED